MLRSEFARLRNNDIMAKIRNLEKWNKFEYDGYKSWKKRSETNKGEDYKVIRPRKEKSCHCGNHSIGKELLIREKNRRLLAIRRMRRIGHI